MNRINRTLYELMLNIYRNVPANYSNCAREAGVGIDMAKRAWLQGWDYEWALPIRDVLAEEAEAARAARARSQILEIEHMERMRKEAREDAIKARAQEGRMVQGARGVSLGLIGTVIDVLSAAKSMSAEIKHRIDGEGTCETCGASYGLAGYKISTIMKTLKGVTSVATEAVNVSKEAMKMERIHLGRPETVIGIDDTRDENLTKEEIAAEIEELARDLGVSADNLSLRTDH
jgi:hypothetical protein